MPRSLTPPRPSAPEQASCQGLEVEALYGRYRARLLAYCQRELGSYEEAEDVVNAAGREIATEQARVEERRARKKRLRRRRK